MTPLSKFARKNRNAPLPVLALCAMGFLIQQTWTWAESNDEKNSRFLAVRKEKEQMLSRCLNAGKSMRSCEREMKDSWLSCESDADCTAVPSDCGHWEPVSKKFEKLHLRLVANLGGTHCRWMDPTYKKTQQPDFKCVDGKCNNHLLRGAIKDVKIFRKKPGE